MISPGRSGSGTTESTFFRDNMSTQSIIRMIRGGGLPSRRTVAMSADLIVLEVMYNNLYQLNLPLL